MSNVYRKGKYWWCWGHHEDGSRWWASTRVSVDQPKQLAERAARKIERDRVLGPRQAPTLALIDALELLRLAKERKRVAVPTLEIMRTKGRNLIRLLGPTRDVCALTLADTERYLDARRAEKVSDHTIAKELGTLRAALRAASKAGRYAGDPAALWPDALVGFYKPRTRWLTVAEYRKLYAAAFPGRRDALTAYVFTGARLSELGRIHAHHVDLEACTVRIAGTKTDEADRVVPIAPELEPVLRRLVEEHPEGPLFRSWKPTNMRQSLARWCARAGIAPVTANDLRRTFCSWLCSAGVSELMAAKLLGHTSSKMVRQVYAQLSEASLREAIERLPRVTVRVTDASRDRVEIGD